jgi:hypothetical protein
MTGRALQAHALSWLACGVFIACSSPGPAPQTDAEGAALNAGALGSAQQAPGGTTTTQELAVGNTATGGSGGDTGTEPEQSFVAAGAGGGFGQDECSGASTSHTLGEWVPYQPEVPAGGEPARALLQGVQEVMTGSWRGLVSTPWTSPYVVDITFSPDGHYPARCTELGDCCRAFYYGEDADAPIKQWRVDDATLSGNVFGEIDIAFGYDGNFGLPAWQGELSHIERDASGDGLRFEFATSSGYGPLHYDLRRAQ